MSAVEPGAESEAVKGDRDVALVAGGDETAFVLLVDRERPGLVAAAAMLVGDRACAEEIVADVLERTYVRWDEVSRLDRPGAWVRRAVLNQSVSTLRRAGSERRALERLRSRRMPVQDTPAPEDRELWQAVSSLPENQALAVALHYGADLPVSAVAEHMELTETAVKALMHRARSALRSSPVVEEMRP